ncbi:hypothetical protein, partial [Carnobacterium divergens]
DFEAMDQKLEKSLLNLN